MADGFDRRTFLGASAAAAVLGPSLAAVANASPGRRSPRGVAKNVIFMVSDGMSIGAFQLAHRYRELIHGTECAWSTLLRDPDVRVGLAATRSANSEVTDSAAASSAWSIGRRVDSGALNVTPDGARHEPVSRRIRRTGRAIGLVTTTRLTHATPAGLATISPDRHAEHGIANQLIAEDIDVMLGGGGQFLTREKLAALDDAAIVRTRDELRAHHAVLANGRTDAGKPRLVGVFSDDHMAYELDRRRTSQPSLAEMSRVAIDRLAGSKADGFVLQIEGGRVDHAAHACDAAALIHDQLAFDDAVATVLDWTARRDDTLVVVTTDHGNASPSLTLYGPSRFEHLANATASFETLFPRLGDEDVPAAGPRDLVREHTGVELNDDEIAIFDAARSGETVNAFKAMRAPHHVLGALLANHTGVSFVSGNHTAEDVLITAVGPGADRIPTFDHLTGTHHALVDVLDLPPAKPI
jgi:alkaline phosphatase